MSIPQSTIRICSGVRLNSRYEHSIYFPNRTSQYNYFAGKVVKTFSAYSFIRKTWDLNVAATMEESASWNYLFFQNSANGKTYYYFVDNIEYVNDGTVRLKLQIDVLQTYLFDFDLLPSFVDRQHVTDDTRGLHTIEEGLETGEFVVNRQQDFDRFNSLCILVLATINPNYTETGTPIPALSGMYNGVFSGLKIWAVDSSDWEAWGAKLDDLSEAGFLDGIISMWMYPKDLVVLGGENTWSDDDLCKTVSNVSDIAVFTGMDLNTNLNGYTPRNNKLFCYPYNFVYCSNNAGGAAVYRFERFLTNDLSTPLFLPRWKVYGSLSPDGSMQLAPYCYNGVNTNYEEGLSLGGFPTCAWDADVYKMWLAQNQNSNAFSVGMSVLKVAGGVAAIAATGGAAAAIGGGAAIVSGATEIMQHMTQRADREIQPPQARGTFSANVNVGAGKQTFTVQYKSVNAEHAAAIDDFFTMYGYKINRVQTPNIHARKAFTYVKTIGCHIAADLCNEDTAKIEAIFDHGVTFWVNGDRIGVYSDDNSTL